MEWVIGYWQISIQRVWPTTGQLVQMYNMTAPCWHHHLQWLGYSRTYARLFQSLQQAGVLAHLKDDSTVCDCGIWYSCLQSGFSQNRESQITHYRCRYFLRNAQEAHQLLHQAGVKHQLRQSEVSTLPFNDNTFDLVMAAHMLEHLPSPAEGIREMVKMLRPGAPLILSVSTCRLIKPLLNNRVPQVGQQLHCVDF